MAAETIDKNQVETIDLLDVAVFLARYWLILFVLPFVVGATVYLISAILPSNHHANVKIIVPKFISEDALDLAFAKIVQSPPKEEASVLEVLDREISIHATSPQQQSSLNAVRSQLGKVKSTFDQLFQKKSNFLEIQSTLLRQLQGSNDSGAEAVREILLLTEEITIQSEIISAGKIWVNSLDDLKIETRSATRPLVNAVAAVALTGFVVLLFAVLRTLIQHLKRDQSSRIKLGRVRDAFFMRGGDE